MDHSSVHLSHPTAVAFCSISAWVFSEADPEVKIWRQIIWSFLFVGFCFILFCFLLIVGKWDRKERKCNKGALMSRLPLGGIRAKSHWGLFEQLYGTHLRMIPLREGEAEELSPIAHPTLVKVVPGALALLCFHPAPGAANRLSERESALCSAPGARAVSTCTGWSSGGSEDLARPWQPRPHLPIKIPPHSAPPVSLPFTHPPQHLYPCWKQGKPGRTFAKLLAVVIFKEGI